MRAAVSALASIAAVFVPVPPGGDGLPAGALPQTWGRAGAELELRADGPGEPRNLFPIAGRAGYGEAMARFGAARGGRAHAGQDTFAPAGTKLVAVADAWVLETGSGDDRGNYLALWDPRARRTYVYLHMREPTPVRPGQRVAAGDRVGSVGCSGSCWGDHLHFELRRGRGTTAPAVDPLPLLRRWR